MKRRALFVGPFAFVLGVSCSPAPAAPTRVELGTGGGTTFVPILEGGDAELVLGPQGGWHIWTSVRIWSTNPEGTLVTYQVQNTATGAQLGGSGQLLLHTPLLTREDDHYVRVGDRAFMDIVSPSDVVGVRVTLTVRVQGTTGAPLEDVRHVTVVDRE